MNYICTWLCADAEGEESAFPQTGKVSSSSGHQAIYWRCVMVFFITSLRFNPAERHILFTNVGDLPIIDDRDVGATLERLGVEVIHTDFKYKTPKGYYGAFQNQFFEFSILEYISTHSDSSSDCYLLLDADCVFIRSVETLFSLASPEGFISFKHDVPPSHVINGLSRLDMKVLYQELLRRDIGEIPVYHLGEFMLCSVANIRCIFRDFVELWPELLHRFGAGRMKFNEEAHVLSFLYFKNGFRNCESNGFVRRIWTNPTTYRNVDASDVDLCIWHVPAEKTFGLAHLYEIFVVRNSLSYAFEISDSEFASVVQQRLGIPRLSASSGITYFYRGFLKRFTEILGGLRVPS